ncbi:MAG: Ig-like domain-containing protein [Candidatus Methanoperedens sp.]
MNRKKHMNNKLKIGMLLLIAALVLAPEVSAISSYVAPLNALYGPGLSCGICHVDPAGGGTRTAYGNLFRAQANHASNPTAALIAIGSPVSSTPTLVLTTITVSPSTASKLVGATQTFTAAGKDQNGASIAISPAVIWNSSDPAVGTIDSTGVFTALAAGNTTITATNGTGGTVSGTAGVTVTAPATPVLTTITVSPSTASKLVGATQTFTAAGLDQNGGSISISPVAVWNSSNITVGTIDSAGVFTALAAGNTTITVTNGTGGTVSGTAGVTVTAPATPVLTTITVSPSTVSLTVNGTQTFTATALDQFGNITAATITWSSSDMTVGTIDAAGNFTALAAGITTIKAENGTVNGTATVTVTAIPVLTTITVSPSTASLAVNGTQYFTAIAFDQLGHIISAIFTWASSNPAVGTIDATGKFTALSAGTTTITASNGLINGSANVSVNAVTVGHNGTHEEEQEENEQEHEQEDEQEHTNTHEHNNTIEHTNTHEHNNTIEHTNTVEHTNNKNAHTNTIVHTNTQTHKGTTKKNKD